MEDRVHPARRTLIVRRAYTATDLRRSVPFAMSAETKGCLSRDNATLMGPLRTFSIAQALSRQAQRRVLTAGRGKQQNGLEAQALICVSARQAIML